MHIIRSHGIKDSMVPRQIVSVLVVELKPLNCHVDKVGECYFTMQNSYFYKDKYLHKYYF